MVGPAFAVAVAKKATATIVHVARLGQSATLVVLAPRSAIVAINRYVVNK